MTAIDADKVEKKILQNEELVQLILESAEHCSAPMTVAEFREWLHSLPESGEPSADTGQAAIAQGRATD